MRVLVACEYSGTVRDEFTRLGHEAISCDILPTESPGLHYQGDVFDILDDGFDLMIGHPPCTHLANSGARWWHLKAEQQAEAIEFFIRLMQAPIKHIALENPVGILSTAYRKPDQIVQPYWFGDEATKTTCLWLKNLPLLAPTDMVGKGARTVLSSGRSLPEWYNLPQSKDRAKKRSKTFQGFARAMAQQWSAHIEGQQ